MHSPFSAGHNIELQHLARTEGIMQQTNLRKKKNTAHPKLLNDLKSIKLENWDMDFSTNCNKETFNESFMDYK